MDCPGNVLLELIVALSISKVFRNEIVEVLTIEVQWAPKSQVIKCMLISATSFHLFGQILALQLVKAMLE
ncbi:hypothetical protein TNIN_492711 [Trichonephila inaurata madagascariensis]|uniref:Uncharacterized protein n=1 Tax=Trichonephila inaurata madagascariensis TaxID=2747483 RepID=A0A8X7CFD3_9ARAC|nr:hypothetical protein TNIN_157451 [Trichonephila inaurata madagascariensis]GFY73184.1 hypothetical protein TNIN_492711 [Trichonephila inaurata madagascariensis]